MTRNLFISIIIQISFVFNIEYKMCWNCNETIRIQHVLVGSGVVTVDLHKYACDYFSKYTYQSLDLNVRPIRTMDFV